MSNVLENISVPTLLMNDKGIIVFVNKALCELLKSSKEEISGLPIEELVPPEIRKQHVHFRNQYIKKPYPVQFKGRDIYLSYKSKNIPVDLFFQPYIVNDETLYQAQIRDLRSSIKLEKQKNELTQKVLHELKGPISSLEGLVSPEYFKNATKDSLEEDLKLIVNKLNSFYEITSSLLNIKKSSSVIFDVKKEIKFKTKGEDFFINQNQDLFLNILNIINKMDEIESVEIITNEKYFYLQLNGSLSNTPLLSILESNHNIVIEDGFVKLKFKKSIFIKKEKIDKILLVDDSSVDIKFLNIVFKEYSNKITEAKNGKDAISKIEKDKTYLIILDLNMPIMNGFEFIEATKNFTNIKVIVSSSSQDERDFKKVMSYTNIIDYWKKPLNIELTRNYLDFLISSNK